MNTQRFSPSVSGIGRPTTLRRVASLLGALFLAVVLIWSWTGATSSAFAVEVAPIANCDSTTNIAGQRLDCTIEVNNYLDLATDEGSSVVTVTDCRGAAGAAPLCTSTTTASETQVINSVSQCNESVNGGGGTVTCTVSVINTISGPFTTSPATINQCVGSGAGGGDIPLACNPVQSTTNATVDQCNGSVNGGGAPGRVNCTVLPSTQTSALPVMVSQCNGSANGGGSIATCSVSIQNLVAAVVGPTPTPSTPTGTPSTPGTPTGTPSTPATPSGTPSTPSGTPSTPSTTPGGGGGGEGGGTPTTPAVPVVPGTPSGSAAPSTPGKLAETGTNDAGGLFIGALSLLFAGAVGVLAVNVHRHRRSISNNSEL
jgi:hypothetical protein